MKRIVVTLSLTGLAAMAGDTRTLVGTGMKGYSESGILARGALVDNPFGITRGPDGMIYFCEFGGHAVRRITAGGMLEIVAGVPGKLGYDGDGGPADKATLNQPHEIRFDQKGDLYISDMSNQVIRKVEMKTMTISTFAGAGREKGFAGDGGPADKAKFSGNLISLAFGPEGDLYICDIGNNRLRKIDMKTGVISTVCGNGQKAVPADGDAFSPDTPLHGPRTLEFDKDGNGWLGAAGGQYDFQDRYEGEEAAACGRPRKARQHRQWRPSQAGDAFGSEGLGCERRWKDALHSRYGEPYDPGDRSGQRQD